MKIFPEKNNILIVDTPYEIQEEEILIQETINGYPEYLLNDSPIVGFDDFNKQILAYEFLSHGIDFKDSVVVNHNCKRGDYYNYIKNINSELKYIGFDKNNILIEVGKFKYINTDVNNALKMSLYEDNQNFEIIESIINNQISDNSNLKFINILPVDLFELEQSLNLYIDYHKKNEKNTIQIYILMNDIAINVEEVINLLKLNDIEYYGIDHSLGNDIYKIVITL